jgi:hypothetical protein
MDRDHDTSMPVQAVKLIQDIPVIFADGVISQSYIPGISKFYLYRTDIGPDVDASQPPRNVPVVQVVMSARGFAGMLHFFHHRLKIMIRDGAISQDMVDSINSFVYDEPPPPSVAKSP